MGFNSVCCPSFFCCRCRLVVSALFSLGVWMGCRAREGGPGIWIGDGGEVYMLILCVCRFAIVYRIPVLDASQPA